MNNTIVLKNDAVLYLLEKPVNSRRNGRVTTHVIAKEPRFDITSPVNGCYYYFSGQAALLNVLRVVAAGTVSYHKEPLRLDLPQILHYRSCLIRSVEDGQKDGDLFIRDTAI